MLIELEAPLKVCGKYLFDLYKPQNKSIKNNLKYKFWLLNSLSRLFISNKLKINLFF